ncbi:acyl-CoA dehydrogenase family protein [Sulfoacidibacillus thermotolerans]|uniref:Acyl-CoA dehydrogenase n=1 Tax=Sulfoacidibacillus thermotolerans TaxID=1765684 RepID=A0A2U3DBR7_SULT2|nr:acyl-CoA dehydrogenase family protein [Sulfoacidibacillus thermotolerans]PWI58720.1 acyl-CoA dehydrogenase [Sulfoacidibacillus thermotolerans]
MNHISYAYGQNHFALDDDLQIILQHYWPEFAAHKKELIEFGAYAGRDIYETVYHVDHDARPILMTHDLDGNRIDRVRLSPAHRAVLQNTAHINRPPYEGGSWHHHFALGYLIGDPGMYCILTITGQTAYAIHKYAPEFNQIKEQLLRGDAYGATWMTESQGGSDLGANTAIAFPDGDHWRLTADKYFASGAGLTDYAITTARPHGAKAGPKGLALFLLPRVNKEGQLNFHIRRLKDKSATRSVPSGEAELNQSEAYLIGEAEKGIYYTLENLTVSRLANAIGAMGTARKAHLEVLGRVQRRQAFGSLLLEHPLIRRDLTDLAVRLAGGLALSFHAIEKFDKAWEARPPYTSAYHYARFLTHVAKNKTANHASVMTAMAMELFGGLGFLEEYAVAHWHREALITPIWEGPSNIQALDFLETINKQRAHESYLTEFIPLLEQVGTRHAKIAKETIESSLQKLASLSPQQAQWHAKHVLDQIADATQVALLYALAHSGNTRYEKLAELYATHFILHEEYPDWALQDQAIWGAGIDA